MKKELAEFQKNIFQWYDFKKTDALLLINGNEILEKYFKTIFSKVVLKSMNFNTESEEFDSFENLFDYIIILHPEQDKNLIAKVKKYLKQAGTLLIIGRNELGMNNWSKYDIENQEVGIQKLENLKSRPIGMKEIKNEITKNEFSFINTFYVFPNIETTELILNQNFKLEGGHLEKYKPEITKNEIRLLDETKVLKNIISKDPNMLEFFTDAYFMEISNQEIKTDITYASFNNCRKEEYRLITIIRENGVEKIPANEKAKKHLEAMKKTITHVKEDKIDILDFEEKGKVRSQLIKDTKTLDRILAEQWEDLEKVASIFRKMQKQLEINSFSYENLSEEVKQKEEKIEKENRRKKIEEILQKNSEITKDQMKKLHFVEHGFWDMIAKNCFWIQGKFLYFDQEWEKPYLPVEFIIYRSIINCYDLVRRIKVEELFQRLELLEYIPYFQKLDNELREELIDKEVYKAMYQEQEEIKAIDNLMNDNLSYQKDNQNKEEYIHNLERMLEELKEDNARKQEYITILEKEKQNKEKHEKREGFFSKKR